MPAIENASAFEEFIQRILKPMLPGTEITVSDHKPFNKVTTVAVYVSPTVLRVRSDSASQTFYTLSRSHGFDRTERRLVEQLIRAFGTIKSRAGQLADHLEDYAARLAVAKTLAWGRERQAQTIASVLEIFTTWSGQTYEGERVSAGLIVGAESSRREGTRTNILGISKEDFFKSLTNGVDCWWRTDAAGGLEGIASIEQIDSKAQFFRPRFYPQRYEAMSGFSIGGCVGVALNRNGEILVFQGELKFAKRRGAWIYFGHEAIIKQMSSGTSAGSGLRKAVYGSCIDASFARTGACIGVLRESKVEEFLRSRVVDPADLFSSCTSAKAQLAKELVQQTPFQLIPRTIRKEILRLDGAVVLGHDGRVFAAGAILELGGAERGNLGGRSAAAKALSRFGLGIKVSEDGMISCYKPETGQREPCFKVG